MDIDKAIRIIRETELDADVVPNLIAGFDIDEIQADYVSEIKLRNINKEYILKRINEISSLEEEISDLEATLNDPKRIQKLMISELRDVAKKHGEPRRTSIIHSHEIELYVEEESAANYPVHIFLSKEGYFKKITPQSLRMSGEQKYKEGDSLHQTFETTNNAEIMFFTNQRQVYRVRISDFDDCKASLLGDYLPAKLGMDANESIIQAILPDDYAGSVVFFFENGKAARVELSAYKTTSNRRKLTGAYSDRSPLRALCHIREEQEIAVYSTEARCLIFHTSMLPSKPTRTIQGMDVLTFKKAKSTLDTAKPLAETAISNENRYRVETIPAIGLPLRQADTQSK